MTSKLIVLGFDDVKEMVTCDVRGSTTRGRITGERGGRLIIDKNTSSRSDRKLTLESSCWYIFVEREEKKRRKT